MELHVLKSRKTALCTLLLPLFNGSVTSRRWPAVVGASREAPLLRRQRRPTAMIATPYADDVRRTASHVHALQSANPAATRGPHAGRPFAIRVHVQSNADCCPRFASAFSTQSRPHHLGASEAAMTLCDLGCKSVFTVRRNIALVRPAWMRSLI